MSAGGSCAAPEQVWKNSRTDVVKEIDGVKLHLSLRSSTGYRGVAPDRGRFKAEIKSGRERIYIGCYGTAVEAAVEYAKHVASAASRDEIENAE